MLVYPVRPVRTGPVPALCPIPILMLQFHKAFSTRETALDLTHLLPEAFIEFPCADTVLQGTVLVGHFLLLSPDAS